MKLIFNKFLSLFFFVNFALAKGHGGHSGEGEGEGTSSGSKSNGGKAIVNNAKSHAEGAFGFYKNAPPTSYFDTRHGSDTPVPVYNHPYNSTTQCGVFGTRNSSEILFYIVQTDQYQGFFREYNRYRQNGGFYYAANLTVGANNGSHVMINGTANDGGSNNFRYVFDVDTSKLFLAVTLAYFGNSNPSVRIADFALGIQFFSLSEYIDTNLNGMLDDGEMTISDTSLQGVTWENMKVNIIPVPNNTTHFYIRFGTTATVIYNNTSPISREFVPFNISITWTTANLQLDNIAPLQTQPNSLQVDFSVEGFPTTYPDAKLALISVVSTLVDTPFVADVNATTLPNITALAKSNATYGFTLGYYGESRFEFRNDTGVSSSNVSGTTWGDIISLRRLVSISLTNDDDWIWGTNTTVNQTMVFATFPDYSGTNIRTVSSFNYLNIELMNNFSSLGVKIMEVGVFNLIVIVMMVTSLMFAGF